jgi:glycosyltransferase involved in cell wall biosynthesis
MWAYKEQEVQAGREDPAVLLPHNGLISIVASYTNGHPLPVASKGEVDEHLRNGDIDHFVHWCVSLKDTSKSDYGHFNGFTFDRLVRFLKHAGFAAVTRSAYGETDGNQLFRGIDRIGEKTVSLCVNARKRIGSALCRALRKKRHSGQHPMKLLYVGHILPMEVSKALRASIAANKFECSFVKALDNELDGNVDVVSFAYSGHAEIRRNNISEVYAGKPFTHISPSSKLFLGALFRNTIFFLLELKWCFKNIRYDKVILVINSPLGICALSLLNRIFGGKIVSFTIDTPFTATNTFKGVLGWHAKNIFSLGHRILRLFSGIIVLNKAAVAKLRLRIPYLVVKMGYDEAAYDFDCREGAPAYDSHAPFNIVYAGTLIDYNGVVTLAKAFGLLDREKYMLHVYGSGPLEREIAEYSRANSNIVFHGLVDNFEVLKVFSEADMLINPRVTSASVVDFTFPSKLTEYILSGRPVLTTDFSSMPEEYKKFVFLIEDETPEGFCSAIERVFSEDQQNRIERCNAGSQYIRRHQTWKRISKDVRNFIESL